MLVICKEETAEIIVKKSRFIAIAKPCTSLSEVKSLITQTRNIYKGADHVVHAAVISPDIFSFSDDREPKNTAGRPAFEVLKGSMITRICILIVRFFGGTLLGTGGLVKAYSDATKAVLEKVVVKELVAMKKFSVTIPYDKYDSFKYMLSSFSVSDLKESFDEQVTVSASIPETEASAFTNKTRDFIYGDIDLT